MRAGVGLSRDEDVRAAATAAARGALERAGLARAGCLIVAASVQHLDEALDLCAALREVAGQDARIVGGATTAAATLDDAEIEEGPALGVLALEGGVRPFVVREDGPEGLVDPTALLFVDPSAPLNRVVAQVSRSARIAGGGVAVEGGLLLDDDVIEADAVGLGFAGARIAVAQSHQPIGPPMLVTRAEGRSIVELDGEPAVEALTGIVDQPGMSEEALRFLALGVSARPGESFDVRDYVAVPLLGVDDARGSLEVTSPVPEGASVSFTLRDGVGARRALETALSGLAGPKPKPAWGVYFDCASRGSALHGTPGLDARLIAKALGDFPLLALRTSFELGPFGDGTGVHLFSGVLALCDR